MDKLKQYGPIGAAIVVVSGIAGYLLPVPHAYSQIYIVIAVIGAFVGYGLAAFIVARADKWHVVGLIAVAVSSLVLGIVCGFGYFQLFWLDQSPSLVMRIVHALLYGFTFAFFFFAARWAGLLLAKKDT